MERVGVQIVVLGASAASTIASASIVVSSGGRIFLVTSDLLISLCSRDPFNRELEVGV